MIGYPCSFRGNISDEVEDKVDQALEVFSGLLDAMCRENQIPCARVPYLRPSNFTVLIDNRSLHIIIDELPATGLPRHVYRDLRSQGSAMSLVEAVRFAASEFGYGSPTGVSLPVGVLDADGTRRLNLLSPACLGLSQSLKSAASLKEMDVPPHYDHLERYMRAFIPGHPDRTHNVFLMMRFRKGDQYSEIVATIKATLGQYGLHVLRGDDKAYSEDLWDNVCTYMLGCSYGVAVFEEIDQRDFNPNVAIELGFMMALGKRCLLLKDQRMPGMFTDIMGKLYRPFDTYRIRETLSPELVAWVHDIGLK